ncbi:MAG TPA: long-chain fatty acid--CoA ligase [Candidatus Limnocylindria bacterium]|nr:long-chain fatty acid--CoA ligase [Candidatus Limnocylindria bacterium]
MNTHIALSAEAGTLGLAFRRLAARLGDRAAIRTLDGVSYTWRSLRERVDALAGGLARLGIGRGDTVALMMNNRPEFFVADLAAATIGAVPFSVYQTLPPDQIRYVVGDAGARVAVIEREFVEPFMRARSELPALETVIVVDATDVPATIGLDAAATPPPGFDAEAHAAAVQPEDLLTLIYTSGTTGPPKGVQLSHRNLFSMLEPTMTLFALPEEGDVISWLPSAHIAERALNYYFPMLAGATITTCPNPRQIVEYLPKVRPAFFFAVPRIWEKIKAGLEARLASAPEEARRPMEEALAAAVERVRLQQAGKPVPPELERRVAEADAAFFAPIRALLGLDRAVNVGVGAAPTPRDVLEFFHALGIRLAEGWGMSETSAIGTIPPPDKIKLGTVGKPVGDIEIRLADDGEILIRGSNIMVGYRNLPEKTAEAIDPEGWLATGDVGEIDEEGYLRIVDRKKELIINAAGKNMSPANIESTLKGVSPLIGQACVIGDARPYNTALIVLDPDYAKAWAGQHGLGDLPVSELARHPDVRAAVQAAVDAANQRLARVEQIKRFTLLPMEWLPGGEELTPTMKLKRKPIAQKYAAEIEAMYA